jgi:glycosyltransferase involved in cell wall biosynthesis
VRVLFLNQYFPPDPAPTGILLREVADALAAAGHEVVFASSGQDYRGGQKRGSRMRRELQGLWALFRAALATGGVDAVVSATSPPMLVVIGAVVAKLRRARHYHWLFDMYPELATALGEVPEGAPARIFSAATRWAYRRAECVVALDEDMADRLKGYGVESRIIPPWVFEALLAALAAQRPYAGNGPNEGEAPVWLYSGNLGRAHEWRTLLDAQRLLEGEGTPWRLVFQGGGPAWAAAQEYARQAGLARCEWRPYVPEAELPGSLLAADVLVVTQKPETCGLLWPSKLALVTSLPRRILWVGPTERAIARDLAALPQAGVFAPGDAAGVAKWLGQVALPGATTVRDAAAIRSAALEQWVELVGSQRLGNDAVGGLNAGI